MLRKIIKELIYYTITLVVLALLQHQDLLHTPLARIEKMQTAGNYLHPFIWALFIYTLIASFRWLFGIVMRLKK
jgi:hypothetical protein